MFSERAVPPSEREAQTAIASVLADGRKAYTMHGARERVVYRPFAVVRVRDFFLLVFLLLVFVICVADDL